MRRSRNFRQGGPGQSVKKSSDNVFFLVLSLFYRSRIQRNISFFKLPEGGPTFSRGGGPTFSRGVQLLIPYTNPYNL